MSVDQTLLQVFRLVVPEAALIGTACLLFLLSTMRLASRTTAGVLALAGLGLAAALHFIDRPEHGITTVTPILANDLTTFVRLIAIITGIALVLFTWHEADDRRSADYHACLLVATAGLSLVGSANDLIVLFLALELISIPTYVMLYLPKPNETQAQESAVKYFLLSVMSSALMLFGFSYLYGMTGVTNLTAMNQLLPRVVPGDGSTMAILAVVFVLAGLGFRVTAFPFHFYAPDVYQGGPTGTVAFLAFVPKVAGLAALMKLFVFVADSTFVANDFTRSITMLLWILAAVTMTAGNVMGLLQTNLRRMFAYSGVANGGYLLIGLAVIPTQAYRGAQPDIALGGEAIFVYLIAYGAMTVGAFAVLAYIDSPTRRVETIDDVAGLGETNRGAAGLMTIFLLSMIGLPLTAGFVGKLLLFLSAMATPASAPMHELFRLLALIGAINAAIAAYYYSRVIISMYQRTALLPVTPTAHRAPLAVTAIVCAIVTVAMGVYPFPLIKAARVAFAAL